MWFILFATLCYSSATGTWERYEWRSDTTYETLEECRRAVEAGSRGDYVDPNETARCVRWKN